MKKYREGEEIMIKIENVELVGWKHAIRGMRNPLNSWDKSDSDFSNECNSDLNVKIGESDIELMKRLSNAGTDHRKFMRMITVYADITAPQFWWSEFDTYKVGTVRNSCSKMHRIHVKEFVYDDFSHEGIDEVGKTSQLVMQNVINELERLRNLFNETKEKKYWRAIIELLPSGYNMKATVMMNYEVLANMYKPTSRRYHKLDEWNVNAFGSFCSWIETLPYSDIITGKFE